MLPTEGQGAEPKSRKGRGNKSPKPQEAKSKVKIAAYVSVESSRRLGIQATMTGQDRSTIIEIGSCSTARVTPREATRPGLSQKPKRDRAGECPRYGQNDRDLMT